MKLNNIKKPKKNFDPVKHWYTVLMVFLLLTIIVVLYSVYSFFYIKKEILMIEQEAQNSVVNSTTTNALDKSINSKNFLNDINNLNKNLETFEKKEIEYNRLIKLALPMAITATTTASTTVATSTN
jgi:hypothetical protein